jgi:quinol monooxygenase YgiN
MSVNVLLEIQVEPANVAQLKVTLGEMLAETRVHDGCISVHVIQNQDDRGNFVLIQRWQSRAHYEDYNAWRAATGAAQAASSQLAASYSTRFFDYLDV